MESVMGFIVGILNGVNKADEMQQKINIIMVTSGTALSYFGGTINPEWAVDSVVQLLVNYIIGLSIGGVIGLMFLAVLDMINF
ncbi:hypothetical protein [Thermococcus piezophilus]|nr:hypothetical protein [Thermococcus piezophilus]